MKKLFMLMLLSTAAFAGAIENCTNDGNPGTWQWVSVCPPGHGVISFYVCASAGDCPGSAWCPGNNGCNMRPARIPLSTSPNLVSFSRLTRSQANNILATIYGTQVEGLVASFYTKKEAE